MREPSRPGVCSSLCTNERNRVVSGQIRVPGQPKARERELRQRGEMDFLAPHRSRSSHRRRPSLLVLTLLAAVVVVAMFRARNRRRLTDGGGTAAGTAPVPPGSPTFAGERHVFPSSGEVPPLVSDGDPARRQPADLAAARPPEPADPPAPRAGSPAGPPGPPAGSPAGRRIRGRRAVHGRVTGLGMFLIGASIASCAALALANPDSRSH